MHPTVAAALVAQRRQELARDAAATRRLPLVRPTVDRDQPERSHPMPTLTAAARRLRAATVRLGASPTVALALALGVGISFGR